MIGVLGNLGRVVGREMIEETVGRLIAGRTAEDIFAREEVARRIGQKSFDMLVDKFKKDMKRREHNRIENDDRKKEIDWNARMNDFARNLNTHYRQNNKRREKHRQ